MKCESTVQYELTGVNGTKGVCFSNYIPCRKVPGLIYPDASELNAICAFNPLTGEVMTVKDFRTASNIYYGGWYNKVKRGWTLIAEYRFVACLTIVTFPTTKKEEDEDYYW